MPRLPKALDSGAVPRARQPQLFWNTVRLLRTYSYIQLKDLLLRRVQPVQ